MYSNFKEQAIEFVKLAIHEDDLGNYASAFPLYMNALEYFKIHLKYEKDPKIREDITQKLTEYISRAELIRVILDEPESAILAVESTSTIESSQSIGTLSPNVEPLNFKEKAIEYVKLATHEDNLGNYANAFPLYMNALESFKTYLNYEKDPKIHDDIIQKFTEYICRAEAIRSILDEPDPAVTVGSTSTIESSQSIGTLLPAVEPLASHISLSFWKQAAEYVKQAVEQDNLRNYAKAFPLYMNALEYFRAYLKYEKNPKIYEEINLKFIEYLQRAEEIRAFLDVETGNNVNQEPKQIVAVGSGSTMMRSLSNSKVMSAVEPTSPRVSACGFCYAFGKKEKDSNRKG